MLLSLFFCSSVIIEVPHFASLRDDEREITVLRSEDGQRWRPHTALTTIDDVRSTLSASFDGEGDYHHQMFNPFISLFVTVKATCKCLNIVPLLANISLYLGICFFYMFLYLIYSVYSY